MKRLLAASAIVLALGACNEQASNRSTVPIPAKTVALMSSKGMSQSDPILVRVYKKENELEVWKKVDGHYAHLKTFPICRWSGQLGPKVREGDRQAPEGFYTVNAGQMNPNSSFYLSFDTGYPNAFDRSNGRTGAHLMVHGDCSSSGCYAMTDEGIAEVYAIAREALAGGQRGFQLQAYPFRMNAENLAKYRNDPHMAFWRDLKKGSDHFEITRREPKVSVCERRYAFNQVGDGCKDDPTLAPAVAQKDNQDRQRVAELVAEGTPAVRALYSDGDQHEAFRGGFATLGSASGGRVSRPEAVAAGRREVSMDDAKPAGRASLAGMTAAKAANPDTTSSTSPKPARAVVASADPGEPLSLSTRDRKEPVAKVGAKGPEKVSDRKAAAKPSYEVLPNRVKAKTSALAQDPGN